MEKGVVLIVFLCLLISALAVDKSKFKTCEQSGFCKRNRGLNGPERQPIQFSVVESSIKQKERSVEGEILSSKKGDEGRKLSFVLTAYKSGVLRLEVDEVEGVKPRYRVKDILLPLQEVKLSYESNSNLLSWGKNVCFRT